LIGVRRLSPGAPAPGGPPRPGGAAPARGASLFDQRTTRAIVRIRPATAADDRRGKGAQKESPACAGLSRGIAFAACAARAGDS
jgi:hypothetical protein